MIRKFTITSSLLPLLACTPELPSDDAEPPPLIEAEVTPGYPTLTVPCRAPVAEPTHLVVTSTDFGTGAVGLVELATRTVFADLALASSDAVPVVDDGRVFIINRHGFDYIDELDPHAELALVHEWAIAATGLDTPSNPHDLALDPDGHAWVTLHGAPELQRFWFPSLHGAKVEAELALDLSSFADADAIPELSLALSCGELLFVSAERIDRESWVPAEQTVLIPMRAGAEPTLFEFDAEQVGADGIELLGIGVGPWRLDPADPSGHTILLRNTGIERIDLASGTREWVVSQQLFEDAGYERLQLAGFDVDESGRMWVAAASADFSEYSLLRVDLAGAQPSLVIEVQGLQSVSGALEIVGHEAWFADTTIGASGLRIFDLSSTPVLESPESPLPVGLPPIGLAPLDG
jgi:streptogramin lyase